MSERRPMALTIEEAHRINIAVAEKVMGYPAVWTSTEPVQLTATEALARGRIPSYSTDISAAWEVVEHIHKTTNLIISIQRQEVNDVNRGYYAVFMKKYFPPGGTNDIYDNWHFGETAPHAICLAALKVMGVLI